MNVDHRPLLAVLLLVPFMYQADAAVANVATPSIHVDLHASGAALELVIAGYVVAFSVLVVTGARLGQAYGYRRILVAGVLVFTTASLLCGLAPNPLTLVLARVLQGCGGALMFPQALTGIQLNFSGERRLRAIGMYAIALSSGAVMGQILGGLLVSADVLGYGWRAIFLINVPIGGVLVLAAMRVLPAGEAGAARRLDLAGVAALSTALLLFVVPLSVGRSEGWPVWAWLCLAAGVAGVAAFLALERRVADAGGAPLVALAVLARPAVGWALVTLLAATGTYYALLFTLAQYLQRGLGYSPFGSGLMLVSWVAAFGVAGRLVARLPRRVRHTTPVLGCLLLAGAYAAIGGVLFTGSVRVPVLVALLGLGGLGLGAQFSYLITHLTTAVPVEYASDISGVSTTVSQVGGAIGVAGIGALYLGAAGATVSASHATHAFAITSATLAAVAAVAAGCAYRCIQADRSDDREFAREIVSNTP